MMKKYLLSFALLLIISPFFAGAAVDDPRISSITGEKGKYFPGAHIVVRGARLTNDVRITKSGASGTVIRPQATVNVAGTRIDFNIDAATPVGGYYINVWKGQQKSPTVAFKIVSAPVVGDSAKDPLVTTTNIAGVVNGTIKIEGFRLTQNIVITKYMYPNFIIRPALASSTLGAYNRSVELRLGSDISAGSYNVIVIGANGRPSNVFSLRVHVASNNDDGNGDDIATSDYSSAAIIPSLVGVSAPISYKSVDTDKTVPFAFFQFEAKDDNVKLNGLKIKFAGKPELVNNVSLIHDKSTFAPVSYEDGVATFDKMGVDISRGEKVGFFASVVVRANMTEGGTFKPILVGNSIVATDASGKVIDARAYANVPASSFTIIKSDAIAPRLDGISASTTNIYAGDWVKVNGKNLTTNIVITDSTGAKVTPVEGSIKLVNDGARLNFKLKADMPVGDYTVKVLSPKDVESNSRTMKVLVGPRPSSELSVRSRLLSNVLSSLSSLFNR